MKKLISILCMLGCVFSLVACGSGEKEEEKKNTMTPTDATSTDNVNQGTGVTETETLKVGKAEYAAHGTKGFCVAFAVLQGDTIVAAYVDDYQVMSKEEATVVPNSDKDFGKYFTDIKSSLASKRVNSSYYSKLMKDNAGATISIAENFDAIANYAVGKTVPELQKELDQKDDAKMVDAVSGSTLADTRGYLMAILEAAKNAESTDNAVNNEDINDQTGNSNPSGADKNNQDLSKGAANATDKVPATDNANKTNNDNATNSPNATKDIKSKGAVASVGPTQK
ncbi:MAG: hypothetical protein Q4G58_04040 [bacterium]|nr:hypothetical protein [bacterium]